jgi:hypothetical protein
MSAFPFPKRLSYHESFNSAYFHTNTDAYKTTKFTALHMSNITTIEAAGKKTI